MAVRIRALRELNLTAFENITFEVHQNNVLGFVLAPTPQVEICGSAF